eukprot:scaffold732_cov114-Cylindrotheca_fusiformis.AAC.2
MGQMDVEISHGDSSLLRQNHSFDDVNMSCGSLCGQQRPSSPSDGQDRSMNSSRHTTVNIHNSILDLSKDEEEDDDEQSVLFEDLAAVSVDSDDDVSAIVSQKFSLHSFLGDTFMDGLCTADVAPEPPCAVVSTGCSSANFGCNRRKKRARSREDRVVVGTQIWDLLGCTADVGDLERDEIWSRRVDLSKPTRANIKHRLNRIRKLRNCNHGSLASTRHGITLSHSTAMPGPLERARTIDHEDHYAGYIGHGMNPIVPDYDGYDSDPEVLSNENTPIPSRSVPVIPNDFDDRMDEDMCIRDLVQQTMNSTWTFTWHPSEQNVKDFGLESSKPLCVNVWIERGTALPNGHVAEPTIMWRDAYQPNLVGKHKLNKSTQKPWTMRLLNTCRIAPSSNLDRSVYPMARSQNCFVLKTNHGNHEFLFETTSSDDVGTVCDRWKMTVARFASLAVMEDVEAIEREFFHPTSSSQMLVIDDC